MAPLVSHLKEINAIEAKAYGQKECFEAGVNFARTEGIVPAPEATHAVKGAIDAALECKKNGEQQCGNEASGNPRGKPIPIVETLTLSELGIFYGLIDPKTCDDPVKKTVEHIGVLAYE